MDDLRAELKQLRRGRGVLAADIADRAHGNLRALLGIPSEADPADIRSRLTTALRQAAQDLPDDLRIAFLAAVAAHPQARHRTLGERLEWAAERLGHVDPRTVRRRMDDALERVATTLAATTRVPPTNTTYAPSGWYLASLRTTLILDGDTPEAIEEREVVATVDRLEQVLVSARVPRHGTSDGQHSLQLKVLFGGTSVLHKRPTDSYFQHYIRLPRPLRYGERGTVSVSARIPPGQPMRPQYVYYPLRRCDAFELRVRFDRRHSPHSVWRIPGLPRGVTDDYAAVESLIAPDPAGEVRLEFHSLQPGFGYGVRWRSLVPA